MKEIVPYAEIPREEYEARLERVQEQMEKDGLDGMLLFNNKNVYYFTGYRRTVATVKVEGVLMLRNKPPIMFMPQLTSRYCEKAVWIEDVRFYGGSSHLGYPKTVVDLVVQSVKKLGLNSPTIGIELGGDIYPDITYADLNEIQTELSDVHFVDAAPTIWNQRKIKTPYEQDIMRKVGQIGLDGFIEGLKALKEGITEKEISDVIWNYWASQGISDTPMEGQLLVRSGSQFEGSEGRYRCTHARPTDYPIQRGEMVLIDAGPCYRGYFTDIMRQGCVGKPSPVLRELFDIAVVGFQRGIEMLKPGVKISELHKESIEAMKKRNPDIEYPLSFVGHSIGLAIHEPPWFSADEESLLEPGMVINLEIGAYDIPQWRTLGGFLEDLFLITENGCENLTEEGSMNLWISE